MYVFTVPVRTFSINYSVDDRWKRVKADARKTWAVNGTKKLLFFVL